MNKNYKEYQEWSLTFFKKYWKYNLLFVSIFFLMFLLNIYRADIQESKYAKKYPYYNTANSISGVVVHIENSNTKRGEGISFKLDDGQGYSLGWSIDQRYSPSKISEFIRLGDSIRKDSGADIVFIHRNDIIYSFEISKRIDKLGNYY